jgi:O-antigen ligase
VPPPILRAVLDPTVPDGSRPWWSALPGTPGRTVTVLVGAVAVALSVAIIFLGPVPGPLGLLLVGLAAAAVAVMVGRPGVALIVLLLASFTRLAIKVPALPAEPMILSLAVLVASAVLAGYRRKLAFHFGWLELAMVVYLLWNIASAVWPHALPAETPRTGQPESVMRFIITGTVLPFVVFVVGRALVRTERAARPVLITIVALAGYSAVVSILQFTGPAALVWPRYIVDAPEWEDRANGIFNQPVVNGLVMVAGFLTAMFLAHERTLSRFPRLVCLLVALLCVPGIYLTRTRAVWLAFGLGVVLCVLFARGRRTGFAVVLGGAVAFILATWSTFTSSDRAAGGVGSSGEIDDRLNSIATSIWAIEREPVFGWGIGRFTALNTYYHQKWAPGTDFNRGYSISSHENELGIAAELGLLGLALWLLVLVGVVLLLLRSLRRLPVEGLGGRPVGLLALTVLVTWVVAGFTADLRFFDFANLLVFLLVGSVVGLADRVVEHRPDPPDGSGSRRRRGRYGTDEADRRIHDSAPHALGVAS